jgi:predicted acyltransferase
MNDSKEKVPQGRLMSLDALRGFDMLLLTGIAGVFMALGRAYDNSFLDVIANQLKHTPWEGLHAYDLIFPLFIFMVGMSIPFALKRRFETGFNRKKQYYHIVRRTIILILLGLIINGLLGFKFSNFTYTGVLQRIAIAYFFASIIVMNTKAKAQAIISGSLLVIYWLLMILVPVPGHGAGNITPEGNLHTYIDQLFLPGKLNNIFYDEDGILQQISSIAMCLAGVTAGNWLRSDNMQNKKVMGLLGAGVISILMGLVWSLSFPVIFRLWSSSYAMIAIGINCILIALFYWLIDVKGYKKWAFPFVVTGMNSITIYVVSALFNFGIIVNIFVHGFIDELGSFKPVFYALCILTVKWLFLYFLYRQKYF